MKKILIIILILNGLWAIGETRESFQAKVKVDLIKSDNSIVNILDGSEFIELKTTGEDTDFGGVLSNSQIPLGEYKGVKITISAFKHKLILANDDGQLFYTTDQTVAHNAQWLLSTNEDEYAHTTTLTPEGGFVLSTTFPTLLKITDDNEANLIWINEFGGAVTYEFPDGVINDGNLSKINWADEATLLRAFLPDMPTKKLSYTIRYTNDGAGVKENRVTYFLNTEDELIGAFMSRPHNQALNGADLLEGSKNGNIYSIKFQDGDDSNDGVVANDYYEVNVTLSCPNTSENITISTSGVAELPSAEDGYTLTVANLQCSNISIP